MKMFDGGPALDKIVFVVTLFPACECEAESEVR